MAYETRLMNDPNYSGYIVQEKITCGKPNCRCVKKGKKHLAYYLYWREYKTDGSKKLRKKYIKKSEAYLLQRRLAINKSGYLFYSVNPDRQDALMHTLPPNYTGDDQIIEMYLLLSGSKLARKILTQERPS